ncbi:Hypothetical predicted protein [Paramuricea clavata]|uniref:Uncharacterized protein n=1 Tax=Paramuricea clavata TaxID=317549 RepID=A0A7D9KYK6_PARCT|nr:Hypothetical predicted protein [Paramuricea clavata]
MADRSGDYNCTSGAFNGETDGQILCKHVEISVDVCEDEFLREPNGNFVEISMQNDAEIDPNDVMELRTLKSTLKRRPPVVPKAVLVKYRSNKEGYDGVECSETRNDNASLNISAESEPGDLLSANSVRKRDSRTSRNTRNSAGASGGVFSDEFQPDFGEFHREIDETVNGKVPKR